MMYIKWLIGYSVLNRVKQSIRSIDWLLVAKYGGIELRNYISASLPQTQTRPVLSKQCFPLGCLDQGTGSAPTPLKIPHGIAAAWPAIVLPHGYVIKCNQLSM